MDLIDSAKVSGNHEAEKGNARRFFESPGLIEIRKEAGVKTPTFIYLEEIEHGVLSSLFLALQPVTRKYWGGSLNNHKISVPDVDRDLC